jgi:hypothetical protein
MRLSGGRKCHAIALLNKRLCYFHHASNARRKPARRRLPPVPFFPKIPISSLFDQHSVREARMKIERAMATGLIDRQRGKLMLHAFQIAAYNLNTEGNR